MPSAGNTVAELQVRVSADTSAAETGLSSLGGKLGSVGGTLATAFGGAALAGIAGLAAGFAGAVTAAAGFEQQMSAISAVSGATAGEMSQLSTLALDLGKNTSFSASEAAQGIEELIKAGVSIGDVMGGAAAASLSLAAAGAVSVGAAAELAADAMNMFSLKGADLGHVADVIAGAANASSIDVEQFKFSLSAVGAVASAVGFNFDDTAAAIAVLGQAGIKGSDAGTSLKTMLLNLQPSTKAQTSLFRQLGLITADGANQFFDASGKVKSMSEVAGTLQNALKGMTDQQRLAALETMFGSDAIRAGVVFSKAGAEGFNEMAAAMSKVTAEAVAAERLNNLKGSFDQLMGSVETLAITFGLAFLPMLKGAVDGLTGFVNALIPIVEQWGPAIVQTVQALGGYFRAIAEDGDYLNDFLTELPVPIQGVVLAIGTVVSAIQSLITLFTTGSIEEMVDAYENLVQIMGPDAASLVTEALDLIIAGVQAMAEFVVQHFGTIVSWFQENWPLIQRTIAVVLGAIMALWEMHGANIITVITSAWTIVTTVIEGALDSILSLLKIAMQLITGDWDGAWQTIVDVGQRNLERFGTIFSAAWDGIVAIVDIQTGNLRQTINTWLSETGTAIEDGWQAAQDAVSGAWDAITSTVQGAIDGVTSTLSGAWDAITSTMQGAWDGYLDLIKGVLDSIKTAISTVWNQIPEDIRTDLEKIAQALVDKGAAWVTTVTSTGADMLTAISAALGQMVDAVTTWATSTFISPITALVGTATTQATAVGTGMLASLQAQFTAIVTAVGAWVTSFLAPVTALATTAAAAALAVGTAILTALQAKLDAVVSAVGAWGGSVSSAISGIAGSVGAAAASIGQSIVSGIANAINAGVGAIRDAAYRAARAALDAAIAIIKPGSPSKVFTKLGETIPAGLVKGIDSGLDAVGAAMAGMVPTPSAAPYGGAGGAGSYGGGGMQTLRVEVAIGGRVAEEIFVTGRELAIRRGRVPA